MNGNKEPSRSVDAVRFSIMTNEEREKLSALEITPETYLDDLRLGLTSRNWVQKCQTCGQSGLTCHGHCGHIVFSEPVFHPQFYANLQRLLYGMCFKCDRFKASEPKVEKCISKLEEIVSTGTGSQYRQLEEEVNSFLMNNTEKCDRCGISNNYVYLCDLLGETPCPRYEVTPSQIKGHLEMLWENEAKLCSYFHLHHTMYFLNNLLVPPVLFRDGYQNEFINRIRHANTTLIECETGVDESVRRQEWTNLQHLVNDYFYELFCKNMKMFFQRDVTAKPVKHAFLSAILPDPYLDVNEIGIPCAAAKLLTYPERVTPWNCTILRNAILNGLETHPGADTYSDEWSTFVLLNRKACVSYSKKLSSSRGVATEDNVYKGKVVHRHMRDGDTVLVNHQPTLHKQKIKAFRVRVLPEEKTIRFHYANCDSFNADFGGDVISVHLPQDEISRAEAYTIVDANQQYIDPTSGDPKRGLIQDHIVGAVILTMRDTFLTLEEFQQLCMSGVCSYENPSFNRKSAKRLSVLDSENMMPPCPPVIIRPRKLWTGKQVITTILNHITSGLLPLICSKRAKLAREYFGKDGSKKMNDESLTTTEGVFRKKRKRSWPFGKKPSKSGMDRWISENSSHTMDEDVVFVYKNELVQGVVDQEQFGKYGLVHTVQEMYGSNAAGNFLSALSRVLTAFLQMHGFTCGIQDLLLAKSSENQRKVLLDACLNCGKGAHQQFISHDKDDLVQLDGMMNSKLNTLNSAVTKLIPGGLIKPFRKNCVSLMTLSGANGCTVNFQQISLFLGQQELEGKRVPQMVSGKTLPCFSPWDSSPRAGGFISDRYLTGLRPQEFYFHCMAGREGLFDTAVKTSCSGYLRRCLIKNLECLSVNYDYTVRDADGSIIQFRYGEDGVDVHKMNYMREFEALALNQQLIVSRNPLGQNDDECFSKYVEKDNEFPNQLAKEAKEFLNNHASAVNSRHPHPKDRSNFMKLVKNKYYMSLAQPGEPVGIIAAQSIGEASTQMTLNTFHHAGRGEMNVTLGIPRLLEILTDASKTIKTPTMTCPLLKCKAKDDAQQLAAKLNRITVAELIENMEVSVVPFAVKENEICSIYKLKLKLYDPELYPRHTDITLEDCQNTLLGEYLKKMEAMISSHLLLLSRISGIKSESKPVDGSNEMRKDGFESSESETEEVEDSDNEKGYDYYEEEIEEAEEKEVELIGQYSKASSGLEQKKKSKVSQRSDKDRAIQVACDGLSFEVHFKLTNEPHILLAQIAMETAEKVNVKNAGKIENCKAVELHLDDSGNGGHLMLIRKIQDSRFTLQTAGVDFIAFWNMQDELDVRFISSNDIQAMLDTYGVEAARATIIAEIFTVFGHYGVTVDMRHLTLIADYMTHTGKYRPLNRYGGLAKSISPFSMMAFETDAKFIIQAAVQGEVDNLQTPTARICLGLPAKVGTGCFDLNQNLDV